MTFPMKQYLVSPACQTRVCRRVIDGGSFWRCPDPPWHQTSKMQDIGCVLGWTSWHPKGRQPPNCCCAPARHGVGIKRGYSKCEACPQLPASPCSWRTYRLKSAPSPSPLGAFTLESALQGLGSWEGLVVSFFHTKRIFLLDRYTLSFCKEVYFPNTNPFQKSKHDLISQLRNCNKYCLFSAFPR